MGEEKPIDEEEMLPETGHNNSRKYGNIVLLVLLILNAVVITTILFVSSLWAFIRDKHDMQMIPAPNKDRSICVPMAEQKGECIKRDPEEYIAEQIDKRMRKSHMEYMADKLKYANVVCRKHVPSVYLFKGLNNRNGEGNLLWKQSDTDSNKGKPIHYNADNGVVNIIKSGIYYISSQITEIVENVFQNGTTLRIYLTSNGNPETILESSSSACNMVSGKSKRSHFVGSSFSLIAGDRIFARHSHPDKITNIDSFFGVRELNLFSVDEG